MNYSRAKTRMDALGIHASETAWDGTKFDAVVDNNGSIEDLYNQVKNLVSDRPSAKAA
jgi:dephospho-CoA kinase